MGKLLAGMSQKDITPPARVTLGGQFHTRISTHVESKTYVNVLALQMENEQAVFVSCDLVCAASDFIRAVREKVGAQNAEINPGGIIIFATHTHTAPSVNAFKINGETLKQKGLEYAGTEIPPDVWDMEKNIEYITSVIADAICEAWSGRQAAYISPSFGRCVTGYCRRITYSGGVGRMYGSPDSAVFSEIEGGNDSGVELLYVFNSEKKPMGAIVNVACPAQVVEAQKYVSSDFWGKARDFVKERLGDDFIIVGMCSAAGDQSPRDLIRDKKAHKLSEHKQKLPRRADADMYEVEGAIQLGKRLAGVICENYESAKTSLSDCVDFKHESTMLELPIRKASMAEYERAKQVFDEHTRHKAAINDVDRQILHNEIGIIERYEMQKHRRFTTIELHVLLLGDVVFATNPFELFLDYGNQIKARSLAAQTFLIQLACGSEAYLPTKKAEKGGHYSAYIGSGTVGHEGGGILVEKTIDMINALFQSLGMEAAR